jgi:hypothetical protein
VLVEPIDALLLSVIYEINMLAMFTAIQDMRSELTHSLLVLLAAPVTTK